MRQLASKNYSAVSVKIREIDEPLILNVGPGFKLMEYLTSGKTTSHVQLTDQAGMIVLVRTHDIQRVEPIQKMPEVADYV